MLSGGLAEKCRAAALPVRVPWPKVRHHSLTLIVPMAYTSRLLNAIPGIRHAFLDVHETAAFPYAELAPVKLVHGNEVHHYQQPLPTRPHADAVFTAVAGQKVGVVTADCLPLLIASRDGRYVCSVHAGWQGLVSGIVDNSLACFRQQGVALADLVIAVGPHIHPCCYEVSAGFYQQLLDQPGGDRVARHRQRLAENIRLRAQGALGGQAQGRARIQTWRAARTRQIHLGRITLAERQHLGHPLMNAHILRHIRRAGLRLLQTGQRPARPHKIPGARPRLQQPFALQRAAQLHRRGQTHRMTRHQIAQGRHALTRRQGAGMNRLSVMIRPLAVQSRSMHSRHHARPTAATDRYR